MFLTSRVFDIVVKTKDDAYALALSAFDASHQLAMAAKENELRYLKTTLEETRTRLDYERARADSLVDRLLVRDAKVAAVAPAAVEIAKHKDNEAVQRLKVVFDQMNEMGDMPAPKENRAFEFSSGGSAVGNV